MGVLKNLWIINNNINKKIKKNKKVFIYKLSQYNDLKKLNF